MRTGAARGHVGHFHEAGFYGCDAEFAALIVPFAEQGIAAGEPVIIGYDDRKSGLLRSWLTDPSAVDFIGDKGLYATPARAIATYRRLFEFHVAMGAGQIRIAGDVPHPGGAVALVDRGWLETDAMTSSGSSSVFAGFLFPPEVISVAVRWYLRYGLSYRDVEELLAERGITVDHVTIYRWVQRFTPGFIEAARPARHAPGDLWFVDETYLKVAGRWTYLYGRSISIARSSTSCCQQGATWRPRGASSSGHCGPARSRPRPRPTARPSTCGCSTN
jgi:hypothetical protein